MAKLVRRRRAPRRPRRKLNMRRARVLRPKMRRTTDYAKVVESAENPLTVSDLGEYGYTYTTTLSEFQRAQEVAHAYKYYRCAKIELMFIPYANVSQQGGAAATRLPQLYFTVDRVANQQIKPTEAEMLERGISPRMWTKKMLYSWKPNLLQHVQLEALQAVDEQGNPLGINTLGAVNSIPVFNKWLPTQQSFGYNPVNQIQQGFTVTQNSVNPYALRYYGASFCISVEGGSQLQVGDIISKVTWEFKGPRALVTNPPAAQPDVSPVTSSQNFGVEPNTQPTNYGT